MMRGVVVWCAFWLGGTAWAGTLATRYSADMVMEAEGHTVTMRVAMDEGKARSEMEMPGVPGQQTTPLRMVTIVRPDLQKIYILYPDSQTYEEKPLDPHDVQFSAISAPGAATEDLGTETVNGTACTKYRVAYEGQSMWVWASQADGIPVKMQSTDGGTVIQMRNVEVGPQPASLFEIPAGYQPGTGMAGMSNMFKGLIPDADSAGGEGQALSLDQLSPEVAEQVRKLMNR